MIGNPRKTLGRFRKPRAIIARQKSHALTRLLLHLSEELLTEEPARGTGYQTIL